MSATSFIFIDWDESLATDLIPTWNRVDLQRLMSRQTVVTWSDR